LRGKRGTQEPIAVQEIAEEVTEMVYEWYVEANSVRRIISRVISDLSENESRL
jgi:hypothetical protein